MTNTARAILRRDLEPSWDVKQAKEPGFMRTLITWVGGPTGYINTNPDHAVISHDCAVGLMRMPVGNRQAGVHVHTVAEIYVILKGEVESIDGLGNRHHAGPLDCLYIPPGVPHAVRTVGDVDLELIWLHDGIEKLGTAVYLDGPGPFPADDEVRLIRFLDLEPDWGGTQAKTGGHLRWSVNWVAMPHTNRNRGVAAPNAHLAVGVTVLLPGNAHVSHAHSHPEIYVVVRGEAVVHLASSIKRLGPLDALYFPAGVPHALRNVGDEPLYLLWAHGGSSKADNHTG